MGDIEIATKDDRLAEFKILAVLKEVSIPLLAIGESAQLVLGVGSVDGDEMKIGKLSCDNTPFGVVLLDANAVAYL